MYGRGTLGAPRSFARRPRPRPTACSVTGSRNGLEAAAMATFTISSARRDQKDMPNAHTVVCRKSLHAKVVWGNISGGFRGHFRT